MWASGSGVVGSGIALRRFVVLKQPSLLKPGVSGCPLQKLMSSNKLMFPKKMPLLEAPKREVENPASASPGSKRNSHLFDNP